MKAPAKARHPRKPQEQKSQPSFWRILAGVIVAFIVDKLTELFAPAMTLSWITVRPHQGMFA